MEWEQDCADARWQSLLGTLCFVDISGFTNLSERLARRGRVGAEELTEVLNRVFGVMLELSYARGGGLLKFGGDALLLLFTGEQRVMQACSAAVEMRRALREAASIPTSVGRVSLRMSVGLHDGPIDFFRVGASHKELIVTGPSASVTTEMESCAAAGEILVSSAVASALPRASVAATTGTGHLLRWRAPKVDPCGAVPRREIDSPLRDACIPVGLRHHLGVAHDGSHRLATVGFIKFSGVDGLMRREGPEVVADSLDRLISATQAAVEAEDVTFLATDIDSDGGKIVLASGVPITREDDEGRMLRAMRVVVESNPPLPIRVGVNRGHVFAGEVGTRFRATYTVMGDTVNLAARLMSAATTGSVYASPGVVDRSRTLFEGQHLEPFGVKGKSEPIHALAVGQEIGTRRDSARDELPFVGREHELAQLRELLAAGLKGASEIGLVTGEPGIGKTRLVAETVASLGAVDVLAIRGEPYGAATPYRALRDPIRTLLAVERSDNATMAAQLHRHLAAVAPDLMPMAPLLAEVAHIDVGSSPAADAIEPRFRRDRVSETLITLLKRSFRGPVVVVIEDAHWIDDSSDYVLTRMAVAGADLPWSLVVTRPGDGSGYRPRNAREFRLAPLPDHVVNRLVVGATAAAPIRPNDIAAIVDRAGGSPLFIEEILRAVSQSGTTSGLPDSLEAVVGAQIDTLPPLARLVIRHAAVLGRSFSLAIVELLLADAGIELDPTTLEMLADFVESDGHDLVRFRHAVVRDVAYEGLPYRRRRVLHLRAGEAIEATAGADTTGFADLLSLHYSLGQEHSKAWHYARLAGDRALAVYANVEAATHYTRALDAARRLADVTDADRAEVLSNLGDAYERGGLFNVSLDTYRRASRLVRSEPIQAATLFLKRARARERAGSFSLALRELTAGQTALANTTSREAGRCRASLAAFAAMVRWGQERSRDALRRAERVIPDARGVGAREALAQALMVADLADLALHGSGTGARLREALSIFEELDDLPRQGLALGNLGFVAASSGRWDEAIDWFTTSRNVFARSGDAVGSALADLNLGEVLIKQRRADAAATVLEDSVRILRSVEFADGAAYAELLLAQSWCEFGRFDEADELLTRVEREFADLGQRASALEAAIARAGTHVRKGDPHGALVLIERAASAAGSEADQFVARAALVRASAMAAIGDTAGFDSELARGIAAARKREQPHEEALLLVLDNDVRRSGGRETDAASLTRAEQILAGLGVRR